MTSVSEKDLLEVSGGAAAASSKGISRNDLASYIRVLSERPGITERMEANSLTDEDADCIEKHFSNENRFMRAAQFAYRKPIEELEAIASMNE